MTTIDVTCSRSRSFTISSSTVVAMTGSSPVVGSSKSRRCGFVAIARAIATRRRCPPDSSDGIRSMYSPSPMNPSTSDTRLRTSSTGQVGLFVQPVADVLGHGQRIEQRALLEQHADVAADAQKLALGHVVHSLAVHENRAAVGPEESEHKLQHDGFSRAARAEQHAHAPLRHAEADVAQHDVLVEGERNLVEHHGR